MADWFPQLPSYQAVNNRLNAISSHFAPLIAGLVGQIQQLPALVDVRLTDSLPIILSKRPDSARVATDIADKGYCPTKKLYYHGLKMHLIAVDRLAKMPLPERTQFTKASVNDLTALRAELPYLSGGCLVGDKAYASAPLREQLAADQQLTLCTPVKLKKGQKRLDEADKGYSTYVSRMRQPIECFFNWFIELTAPAAWSNPEWSQNPFGERGPVTLSGAISGWTLHYASQPLIPITNGNQGLRSIM